MIGVFGLKAGDSAKEFGSCLPFSRRAGALLQNDFAAT